MITTEVKATLTTIGAKFSVKFEMDITDHMAREIVQAIASLFNDQPAAAEVIRTEKAKTSLERKAAGQTDMFKDPVSRRTSGTASRKSILLTAEPAQLVELPEDVTPDPETEDGPF